MVMKLVYVQSDLTPSKASLPISLSSIVFVIQLIYNLDSISAGSCSANNTFGRSPFDLVRYELHFLSYSHSSFIAFDQIKYPRRKNPDRCLFLEANTLGRIL